MTERTAALIFTFLIWAVCVAGTFLTWFTFEDVSLFAPFFAVAAIGAGLTNFYIRKSDKPAS